jgi:aromatic-amino-acid transaminase
MFEHLEPYGGDPIFKLNDAFQVDERAGKINLTIGYYFDDEGRVPMLQAVRQAQEAIFDAAAARPYLPMAGDPAYCGAVQSLLLGAESVALAEERVVTIQSIGGSGALRLGADFLRRFFPAADVWVSDPSWDNHRAIFEGAGFQVHSYPYYDAATGGLRFDAMLEALRQLPKRSVVLLHACCHNPTGVDLTLPQWRALLPVLVERELLPFLDIAYQGFGEGLEADAQVLKEFAQAGLPFLVASSFSKNFSIYSERCGALSVVSPTRAESALVLGQMQLTVRKMYSSPPDHGARIVTAVLNSPQWRALWVKELEAMRLRMIAMRAQLHEVLSAKLPGRDLGYFLNQRGMFSYTGLSPEQVDQLRAEHALYLLRSGRMCVAGLNSRNVEAAATALAAVLGA